MPDRTAGLSDDEKAAMDEAKAARRYLVDAKDHIRFEDGWIAAREFYAPNMDEANRLRERLGPDV